MFRKTLDLLQKKYLARGVKLYGRFGMFMLFVSIIAETIFKIPT